MTIKADQPFRPELRIRVRVRGQGKGRRAWLFPYSPLSYSSLVLNVSAVIQHGLGR